MSTHPGSTFRAVPQILGILGGQHLKHSSASCSCLEVTFCQSESFGATTNGRHLLCEFTVTGTHDFKQIKLRKSKLVLLILLNHLGKFRLKLFYHTLDSSVITVVGNITCEVKVCVQGHVQMHLFCKHTMPDQISLSCTQNSQFSDFTCIFFMCSSISCIIISTCPIRLDRCWLLCRRSCISS